ncbi:MAG: hypothetical protein GF308_01090 [Candidatus Heimdallarchaeota archaeon]|nr:hypothetical protein [Candidatus Heimdallarchaeota archaeon]
MSMKFYEVLEDGTLEEEPEFLPENNKVLIIVDDQFKRIFLWKGINSGIKKKFIGSRAAAELRKTYYGFAYRLSVVEEGDETREFEFTIKRSRGEADVGVIEDAADRGMPSGSPSTMGLEKGVQIKLSGDEPAKKIIYKDEDDADLEQFAGAPASKPKQEGPRPKRPKAKPQADKEKGKTARKRTILSAMMGGEEPQIIRPAPGSESARRYESRSQASAESREAAERRPAPKPPRPQAKPAQPETPAPPPQPQAKPGQPEATAPPPQPHQQKMVTKIDPSQAFSMIKELGVPPGFERDLVIVGTSVYKQNADETFLIPPDPPEGVFLADDRVARIIIENGVVKVVELLKRKSDVEAKEEKEAKLEQGIEDLVNTFQIEIE